MAKKKASANKSSTANIGFEAKLWSTADKLRNNMDAAEYKHVVLGLIFLKYISDTFEEHRAKLVAGEGDYSGANPEDPDEYKAENVFWVPKEGRWSHLQANAKQPTIGKIVDDAMVAIERDNPRLKEILPKDYARPGLDKQRLGELIDVIATIELTAASEGESTHRSVDLLGRVYEYFLTRFASAEGKNGGQFYTPSCVVRCLVEMLEPYKGRIYDPCCGSAGMFVQSEKFVESHGGKIGDISIYGQRPYDDLPLPPPRVEVETKAVLKQCTRRRKARPGNNLQASCLAGGPAEMISAKPYLRATCPFSTVFYPYPLNMSNAWTYHALSVHFSPKFGQVDAGRLIRRFAGLKSDNSF